MIIALEPGLDDASIPAGGEEAVSGCLLDAFLLLPYILVHPCVHGRGRVLDQIVHLAYDPVQERDCVDDAGSDYSQVLGRDPRCVTELIRDATNGFVALQHEAGQQFGQRSK